MSAVCCINQDERRNLDEPDHSRLAEVIIMRRFDESKLVTELEKLAVPLRVAFAAACAERQMPAYRLFEVQNGRQPHNALDHHLNDLWMNLGQTRNPTEDESHIEEIIALIPQEDCAQGAWSQEATNAQNAGMSVTYALRTRLTGEAQEAAWAARVAYEALDNYVINKEGINANTPGDELQVLSHPLVQAELERQERDLHDLLASCGEDAGRMLKQLRERARAEAANFFGPVS
jgi:uncharacterized protein YjaG (DUF416 family)